MLAKLCIVFARTISCAWLLGVALLCTWAGDDGDNAENDPHDQENEVLLDLDSINSALLERLLEHDHSGAHTVLLSRWADSVQYIFHHFEHTTLSVDDWELVFQGFKGSFLNVFPLILNAFELGHRNEINGIPKVDYTHEQSSVACLLRYMKYLLKEIPETIAQAQPIAYQYIIWEYDQRQKCHKIFNSYAKRAYLMAEDHPYAHTERRHPFYQFMNQGYLKINAWVKKYPALLNDSHRFSRHARAGLNVDWIQQNRLLDPESRHSLTLSTRMANGQFATLLASIVRTAHALSLPHNNTCTVEYALSIAILLADYYIQLIAQLEDQRGTLDPEEEIDLRLNTAILSSFLLKIYTALSLYFESVEDPDADDIEAGEIMRKQRSLWNDYLHNMLNSIHRILAAEEDDENETEPIHPVRTNNNNNNNADFNRLTPDRALANRTGAQIDEESSKLIVNKVIAFAPREHGDSR